MFRSFFSVKRLLDTLFDDCWCTLWMPEGEGGADSALADLQSAA